MTVIFYRIRRFQAVKRMLSSPHWTFGLIAVEHQPLLRCVTPERRMSFHDLPARVIMRQNSSRFDETCDGRGSLRKFFISHLAVLDRRLPHAMVEMIVQQQ